MPPDHYERLSVQDSSFISFEDEHAHMHVAAVQIYEAHRLRLPEGGLDIERIRDYVESRLHLIPRCRQRLMTSPIGGDLIWVDDDRFGLHYHLRHSRLPRPGTIRQLKRMAGRILAQPLDRGKPLWEMWVIEGLEEDRFAVITKVHHCMVDGLAGSELLSTLMTPTPTVRIDPPPTWIPRPHPSVASLVVDRIDRGIRMPLQAGGWLLDLALDRHQARQDLSMRLGGLARTLGAGLASNTPINQPIGPHRRFDWTSMDMAGIRAIKAAAGATVNDVVLAIVAGAMRRYLSRCRQTDVDGIEFKVLAPVSVRREDEQGQPGNHVSAWIVHLPLDEPEPMVRLRRIHETTDELKRSHRASAAELLTEAVSWAGPAILSLGTRLMALGQPFNMVVTNVPGPRTPLYLLDARMLEVIPMVPLMGTMALGIALFSYDGALHWGVTADWDLIPDLHDVLVSLDLAYEELLQAADAKSARHAPAPGTGAVGA